VHELYFIEKLLQCFVPNLEVSSLRLPKSRCAGYMRCEELSTISMAQKAQHILET